MNKKLKRMLQPGMGLYFAVLVCFCACALVMRYYYIAIGETAITAVLFIFYMIRKHLRNKEVEAFIQSTFNTLDTAKGAELPFPTVLINLVDNTIVRTNDKFSAMTDFKEKMSDQHIADVLPELKTDWLISGKHEHPGDVTVADRRYRVYGTLIRPEDTSSPMLGMLYFCDLTEMYQVRDEYIRSRPVVSIILVDNYEELTMNLSESAISTMNAEINDAITKWAESYHGLLRKLERNRYLFVFEKRFLEEAKKEKFSLLEDIHTVVNPLGLAASISFGLGVDGASFEESYNFAALSIEMALSRGGDQAVIKDRLNFTFYGGRAKEADRRSKVRSRVTANSLMELIGQSSQVFIMGHKNADLDAVGAAVGVACLCRKKGKKAYIVLDRENNSANGLLEQIVAAPEYKDTVIPEQKALEICDNRSTLVVVDTNRPDQVESIALLEAIPRICVVDHHRRAVDYIEPVAVNLHEPYASSASELVTELLQYAVEKADVMPIEAKALLAGIVLDTKSFNVRTGERTFEAAAVLRRLGADTVDVKRLMQSDFHETMKKFSIMHQAEMFDHQIALVALERSIPRPMAAQVADDLLNISGISGSFVVYPLDGSVMISARSIGEANVQMILEPLGGGGNTATAGAQIKDCTVDEVMEQLKRSIKQFFNES